MKKLQNGNGNRHEQKIPLYINAFHQDIRRDDKMMQYDGHQQRWPDQNDSVANDGLWLDREDPYQDSSAGPLVNSSFGQDGFMVDGLLGNEKELSENLHQCDTAPTIRFESLQKRKSFDSTTIGERGHRKKGGFPRPPVTGSEQHEVPFQTKYTNAMFSAYSIKGLGNNARSSFPCHHIHHMKEPTLLTLSSFPFRIIYANDALLHLWRTANIIVGVPFFDCFVPDDLGMVQPCLSRSDVLVRFLLSGIGCSMRIGFETSRVVPCFTKAYPVVFNQMGTEQLVYFAMRLEIRT